VRADVLTLRAAVVHPEGKQRIEAQVNGPGATAERLGQQLAQTLLSRGAREILNRFSSFNPSP
jgi:hydroxymethylbilane synthase